jgi:hypothetical protein
MWIWMCWIDVGMVGLAYFMAKCGKLRCVRLDIVEGLVKAVDVFNKSISGGKAEFYFKMRVAKNARGNSVFSETECAFPGLLIIMSGLFARTSLSVCTP